MGPLWSRWPGVVVALLGSSTSLQALTVNARTATAAPMARRPACDGGHSRAVIMAGPQWWPSCRSSLPAVSGLVASSVSRLGGGFVLNHGIGRRDAFRRYRRVPIQRRQTEQADEGGRHQPAQEDNGQGVHDLQAGPGTEHDERQRQRRDGEDGGQHRRQPDSSSSRDDGFTVLPCTGAPRLPADR